MSNARTSDIDRRYEEALDEAEGILSRFIDPATGAPHQSVDLDRLARRKAEQVGMDPKDADDVQLAMASIQNVLKERAVNELTRLDRVYLDLNGEHGNKAWMSTDTPSIAFAALKSTDRAIQEQKPDALTKMRAVAIYFDPKLAGTRVKKDRYTGDWLDLPNQYNALGYIAVVGAYPDMQSAVDAREQLQRAINVIARPADSAVTDDPVRTETVPDIEPPAGLNDL